MRQEEEIVNESMEYEEILNAWENHVKVSAKAYIHALCNALLRKHPLYTHKDIQKQVMKDVLAKELCTKCTVYQSWPDWVIGKYIKDGKHSKFEQHSNSEAIRSQTTIEEYKIVDDHATEPEPETYTSYSVGGPSEPPVKYTPTPTEIYEASIQGFAKAWRIMTHKDYIPGVGEDVKRDYIEASRKFRLRLLKGLDEADSTHYHNILVWIEMLVKDTLNLWDDIQKEKRQKITQ